MSFPPKPARLHAVIAALCVAGFNVVVMDPVKAVNRFQKTAELLYRDRLLDFSKVGGKAAELAFQVLAGENLRLLSATDRSSNPIIINGRVLKKSKVSLGPKDLI